MDAAQNGDGANCRRRIAPLSMFDDSVAVWKTAGDDSLVSQIRTDASIVCFDVSPDNSRILVVSENKISIFGIEDRILLSEKSFPDSRITDGKYSPDGRAIALSFAFCGRKGKMLILDPETLEKIRHVSYRLTDNDKKQLDTSFLKCIFNPDVSRPQIAIVSKAEPLNEAAMQMYDVSSNRVVWNIDFVSCVRPICEFSPDGTIIFTTLNVDGVCSMVTLDSQTGTVVASVASEQLAGLLSVAAFSTDGTRIAIGSHGKGQVHILDSKTLEIIQSVGRTERVSEILFSPDGDSVLTLSQEAWAPRVMSMWKIGEDGGDTRVASTSDISRYSGVMVSRSNLFAKQGSSIGVFQPYGASRWNSMQVLMVLILASRRRRGLPRELWDLIRYEYI